MDKPGEPGVFLSIPELRGVFPWLKKNEAVLSLPERQILRKIEQALYGYLSVQEMESLLSDPRRSGPP
jgi:hypothetical protein